MARGHSFDSNGPVIGGVPQYDPSVSGFDSRNPPMNQTGGNQNPVPKKKSAEERRMEADYNRKHNIKPTQPRQVQQSTATVEAESQTTSSDDEQESQPSAPINTTPSKPLDTTPWWHQPGSRASEAQKRSLDSTAAFNASPEGIKKQQELEEKQAKKPHFGRFGE